MLFRPFYGKKTCKKQEKRANIPQKCHFLVMFYGIYLAVF